MILAWLQGGGPSHAILGGGDLPLRPDGWGRLRAAHLCWCDGSHPV